MIDQYDLSESTVSDIHTAIIDATAEGDVGLGGYPTTSTLEQRVEYAQTTIRRSARVLEHRGQIECARTLNPGGNCGSAVNSYIPVEDEP